MKAQEFPTLEDLQSGRIARINTHQYASLAGCSASTLERKRWKGRGTPYVKDPDTGAVFYLAADVLQDLLRPTHRSTNEYDTRSQIHRLAVARDVKAKRAAGQ